MKRPLAQFAVPALFGVLTIHPLQALAEQQDLPAPETGKKVDTLATVTVSAQKRQEDAQTVPVSVSAIGSEQLEQMHATQLSDYVNYAPSVQMISSGSPGTGAVAVRGITPLGTNSAVSTYIDETPLGSSTFFAAAVNNVVDLLPYDVESFQIFRGPQGTLWGAGAFGGVIQYVMRQPDLETPRYRVGGDVFGLDGSGKLGFGTRASASVPLIPGTLAASISLTRQYTPGYVDNVLTGEKNQNDYGQTAGRFALKWQATDALGVSLSAIKQRSRADGLGYVSVEPDTLRPVYGRTKNDNFVDEVDNRDLDYLSGTINWDLGWADFTSATGYSETDYHAITDMTASYGPLLSLLGAPGSDSAFISDLRLYKTTQEFRLASKPADHFEWLLGAFYTSENSRNYQILTAQRPDRSSVAGLDPLANASLPSEYKEYALFANGTWKFNDAFDISAGLRQARNKQSFEQLISGSLSGNGAMQGNSSENITNWSIGPRWKINPSTMIYARVATGYQPGGPNVAIPDVPASVKSSTLTNYEIGLKSTLLDRRLTLDAAVYDIEWDKIQVSAISGGVSYLVNGGTARSKGAEFSLAYLPTAGLRFGLNGAYTRATLTGDIPAVGGASGDTLPFAPKWGGSATVDYTAPLQGNWSAHIGGGLRYVGERSTKVSRAAGGQPLPSYTSVDLNADIANERWTFRVFVKNLTNSDAWVNASSQANALTGQIDTVRGVTLQPRMAGIGFDLAF